MCRTTTFSMMAGMMMLAFSNSAADARIVVPQSLPAPIELAAVETPDPVDIRWHAFATLIPGAKMLAVLPFVLSADRFGEQQSAVKVVRT
ncbi:MAG: hypothetical protein AAGH60_05745 [Pseudomonadota bacterium]